MEIEYMYCSTLTPLEQVEVNEECLFETNLMVPSELGQTIQSQYHNIL